MPNTFDEQDRHHGAWLAWHVVEVVLRLKLRQASRWRVFLAVLLVSARYGGRDARLGIDDLARLTGLAPRTVKAALAALRDGGLVMRVRRVRLLSVPILKRTRRSEEQPNTFTRRQHAVIARVMAEASELLGSEAGNLVIPADFSKRIGLQPRTRYIEAYDRLKVHGTRRQASVFVAAVLGLRSDERVQGKEWR